MSTIFTPVAEISPEIMSWNIKVRVVRLWVVSDFTRQKIPFSMELVLVDSQGRRIHASVKRTLIYKFQKDLKEGSVYSIQFFGVAANGGNYKTSHHTYKINFEFRTKVTLLDNGVVPQRIYEFVPISTIIGGGYDTDYLADVMGLLTGVGTERENERNGSKTKMNVISIEVDGFKIECTLFGSYVDELNNFLASGEVQNTVVVLQFVKVKCFQAQDKIYVQNCINCTKLVFNPETEEAVKLKQRMSSSIDSPSLGLTQFNEATRVTMEDDFLELTPRNTIEGLKDSNQDSCFIVYATVNHVIDDDDWWYNACICNKAVYPDCKMFFCEKCNKHVMKVVPRYRIKICVIDETDSATFVIFDRESCAFFNKSCAEMFETHDKKKEAGPLPKDISDMVTKSYLFKVEIKRARNSRFEKSYIVKKICTDSSIVQKFKEGFVKSVDVNSVNSCLPAVKVACLADSTILAQDLMPKFSDVSVDNESQTEDNEGLDLSKVSEDLTPLKKDSTNEVTELSKASEDLTPPQIASATDKMKGCVETKESVGRDDSIPLKRDCGEMGKSLKRRIKVEKN